MRPGRNDPCPCGSGKKYKKCCGSPSLANAQRKPLITHVRNIPALSEGALKAPGSDAGGITAKVSRGEAYGGAFGRRREAFCREYTAAKRARIARIEAELRRRVAEGGQVISCSNGCANCCTYPVDASLQECECIAYHLYQNEDALKRFLRVFGDWKERVLGIETCFRRLQLLSEKIMSDKASDMEVELFYDQCGAYGLADIPCPFLVEKSCSIYPLRPYVCAGVVAVTPREWCHSSHPNVGNVQNVKVPFQLEEDMPYFTAPGGSYFYSSMPFLVYRILEEGLGALSSVPGLEELKKSGS